MATHVNYATINPEHGGTYSVSIMRGVMASGGEDRGAQLVHVDRIAENLSLQEADELARGIRHLPMFWTYWDRSTQSLAVV